MSYVAESGSMTLLSLFYYTSKMFCLIVLICYKYAHIPLTSFVVHPVWQHKTASSSNVMGPFAGGPVSLLCLIVPPGVLENWASETPNMYYELL